MTIPSSISVIIPTYGRCVQVQRALEALARQTLAPDRYEVIVSIDGSVDGTREMVAHFPAPYTLRAIWQPNRGRAAACNAGIRLATGEVLVILDDDMTPRPGLLVAHQQAHAGGSRRGVVGAVPIPIDPSSPPAAQYYGQKFNCHLEKLAQPGYHMGVKDFVSNNFSIRRDLLLEVGLFDEDFKIYGHEDSELALRLLRAGVQLVYSPEAVAEQAYTKDVAALARDHIAKGRTAVLFAIKHPSVIPDLRLGQYRLDSWKRRCLRIALLGLSRLWARMPEHVILVMMWVGRRRPARLPLYYALALDYFYWLGVQAALRENRAAGRKPASLAELVGLGASQA